MFVDRARIIIISPAEAATVPSLFAVSPLFPRADPTGATGEKAEM